MIFFKLFIKKSCHFFLKGSGFIFMEKYCIFTHLIQGYTSIIFSFHWGRMFDEIQKIYQGKFQTVQVDTLYFTWQENKKNIISSEIIENLIVMECNNSFEL